MRHIGDRRHPGRAILSNLIKNILFVNAHARNLQNMPLNGVISNNQTISQLSGLIINAIWSGLLC